MGFKPGTPTWMFDAIRRRRRFSRALTKTTRLAGVTRAQSASAGVAIKLRGEQSGLFPGDGGVASRVAKEKEAAFPQGELSSF